MLEDHVNNLIWKFTSLALVVEGMALEHLRHTAGVVRFVAPHDLTLLLLDEPSWESRIRPEERPVRSHDDGFEEMFYVANCSLKLMLPGEDCLLEEVAGVRHALLLGSVRSKNMRQLALWMPIRCRDNPKVKPKGARCDAVGEQELRYVVCEGARAGV